MTPSQLGRWLDHFPPEWNVWVVGGFSLGVLLEDVKADQDIDVLVEGVTPAEIQEWMNESYTPVEGKRQLEGIPYLGTACQLVGGWWVGDTKVDVVVPQETAMNALSSFDMVESRVLIGRGAEVVIGDPHTTVESLRERGPLHVDQAVVINAGQTLERVLKYIRRWGFGPPIEFNWLIERTRDELSIMPPRHPSRAAVPANPVQREEEVPVPGLRVPVDHGGGGLGERLPGVPQQGGERQVGPGQRLGFSITQEAVEDLGLTREDLARFAHLWGQRFMLDLNAHEFWFEPIGDARPVTQHHFARWLRSRE